ncbi:MAG: SMI1/KNR4 family protein [Lysobacterales bacterium]
MNWRSILSEWEAEARSAIDAIPDCVLSSQERSEVFSEEMFRVGSDGDAVQSAESRLGLVLPEDLKAFYQTSNGWKQYGFDEYDLTILPVESIVRLRDFKGDLLDRVSEYNLCDDPGSLILLTDDCPSGVYVLGIKNQNGSSNYSAVVLRFHSHPPFYLSFSDLMNSERQRCLKSLRGMAQ